MWRIVRLFLLFCLILPVGALAKSGHEHVSDMLSVIFEDSGIRSPQVRSCLYEFTRTIDNFEVIKSLPLGEHGHRLYGHWGYSDSIPFNRNPLKEMLAKIAATEGQAAADAAKDRIIQAWRADVLKLENLSARMLGVSGRTAKGFAGILYDIHLLGDYTGVKLDALQNVEALKDDLAKNINRLYGNNSQGAKEIIRNLDLAYKSGSPTSPARAAENMLAYFSKSGDFRKSLRAVLSRDKYIASILKEPVLANFSKAKTVDAIRKNVQKQTASKFMLCPALLQNGKLLVAAESGAGAALVMFAVEGGMHTWEFMKGDILKPEYVEKITRAAINGAAVGGATAVMVILGSNPAGLAVIGVATGVYVAVDKVQQIYREAKKSGYLNKNDLAIFGIPADSVMDIAVESRNPFDFSTW